MEKVLVCGMARSGVAAAGLLREKGFQVTVQDLKTEDKLDKSTVDALASKGVKLYLGSNPDDILKDFDTIVLSPGVPADLPFLQRARDMGIVVIGETQLAYTYCKGTIAAITGTNGKTTTTSLVGAIMSRYNPDTFVVGNIGKPFSEYVEEIGDGSLVAAEMSSFQLETISTFRPRVSAVLNITPDHLDRHKSLENYIKAKERVFENQGEGDYTVLNYNDPATRDMAERTKAKVIFFSLNNKLPEGIYSDENSIYINCMGYNERLVDIDELNIPGGHNVENAMAAAACCLAIGIDIETVRNGLREFKAVEHRIEYVDTVHGVEYYNDSKGTNPDASIKAVLAMKRPICLIAGGYDKHSDFMDWVKLFPGRVKFVSVIGAVREQLTDTLDKVGFRDYRRADTFKEAFDQCVANAAEGDCVLLSPACASWDMFDSFEQRGDIFKALVAELEK